MLNFIKNLFAGSGSNADRAPDFAPIEYNGFTITPTPREGDGGGSTEAIITRDVEGETLRHHFIRADKCNSQDAALETISNKCRMAIDQLGDNIFR